MMEKRPTGMKFNKTLIKNITLALQDEYQYKGHSRGNTNSKLSFFKVVLSLFCINSIVLI